MECFCATIEAQMEAIDQRSKSIISVCEEKRSDVSSVVARRLSRRESKATFHIPKLA